jgi:hypothetical protein
LEGQIPKDEIMKIFVAELFNFNHLRSCSILAVTFGINLLLAQSGSASCIAAREAGVWQNLQGTDPFQIQVNQPNCGGESNGTPPYSITVWVKQSSGALYKRGTFAGWLTNTRKNIYTEYSTGGYKNRQWIRKIADENNRDFLEVRILPESLDSKPNGPYEDYRFRKIGR